MTEVSEPACHSFGEQGDPSTAKQSKTRFSQFLRGIRYQIKNKIRSEIYKDLGSWIGFHLSSCRDSKSQQLTEVEIRRELIQCIDKLRFKASN